LNNRQLKIIYSINSEKHLNYRIVFEHSVPEPPKEVEVDLAARSSPNVREEL